jgi:hypothetical protein
VSASAAKDNKPPEVDAPAKVKPGTTGLLKAGKGMRYFLRVPKRYKPGYGRAVDRVPAWLEHEWAAISAEL